MKVRFLLDLIFRPLLVGLALATKASAAIVIGNLDEADNMNPWPISTLDGGAAAMGFTVTSDFNLASVDLKLVIYAGLTPSLSVAIHANADQGTPDPADDLPGALQFTLSNPTLIPDNSPRTYTFTDLAQHPLSAGTTYWVVAFDNSDSGTDWLMSDTSPSGPWATHFGVATDDLESPLPTTRIGSPYLSYQVNAVPEPAVYGVAVGLVLLAFGLGRSRRTRRHRP
jgi:hypothetical protein